MADKNDVHTLVASLNASAASCPDKTVFAFEGRLTSYATLQRHARQMANALITAGITPDQRVAYVGKNTDIFFELFYGAMAAGVVVAPVNWRLAGPEIAVIVEDSQAILIVVGPEFADLVRANMAEMPRVKMVLAAEGGDATWQSLAEFRNEGADAPVPHSAKTGDVAVQLYTSGTTGKPKGVMLSHANFTRGFAHSDSHDLGWNVWREGDASVLAMPMSHISGTGWGAAAVHQGATCHIQRQFDMDATFDMIEHHGISKIFLVPAALQFLVRHPRAKNMDFSRISHMGYGASPMPLALLRECMDVLGCGFVQFYGMTETTGTVVALPPDDHVAEGSPRMRAAGLALPWVEIRAVDEHNVEVPRGTVGELVTRSCANMVGYWNRPEETAKTIDAEGWLHTGDAGYIDDDGYIFIHDRVKDMIISGGENVYPAEVESALSEHPAIAEVAVIGVPDDKWGEQVKAIVVLRPGMEVTAAALLDWARPRIAGFKTPKTVDFAEVLPRNASGKLLKRELRAPYWKHLARQVN